MDAAGVSMVENLCSHIYGENYDPNRGDAQRQLLPFSSSVEALPQVKYILETSKQPYAQHFAASSLSKIITSFWGSIPQESRLELRSFALNHLATFGPDLESFVVKALVQVLVRVSKLAWFDHPSFQEIVDDVAKFLTASAGHSVVGLMILTELVSEMTTNQTNQTITKHRKVSISFRDVSLLRIFQISLATLKQLSDGTLGIQNPVLEDRILDSSMRLALQCLSFDFIGTSVDESADDVATVQIPAAWRPIFEDFATVRLFFGIFNRVKPPRSAQSLKCLVQMASVRRSLFTKVETRQEYLQVFIEGMIAILRNPSSVTDHGNFHEFCRLLARLKGNFQLAELVAVNGYSDWIQLVANFTLQSFRSWQWSSNSVYYLLNLWSRLVASAAYMRAEGATYLDSIVPQILEAFVMSRLESVQASLDQDLEDPFDDTEHLLEQLEAMPVLCRFSFEVSSRFLLSLFDNALNQLNNWATSGSPPGRELFIAEGCVTWLTYIVGSVVGARLTSRSSDEHEALDGELCGRAFRAIQWAEMREQNGGVQSGGSLRRLEVGIVAFLQQFRKAYIGEQASVASAPVYERLSKLVGISDNGGALGAVLGRIIANLKHWADDEEIVEKTLSLFGEVAAGYSSGKQLLKLDLMQLILQCHTPEHFPFLVRSGKPRHRTLFYSTLTILLLTNDNINSDLERFLAPFVPAFTTLRMALDPPNPTPDSKQALIGVLRDLRGVCSGTRHRHSYCALLEWLYPDHLPLLSAAVALWANDPDVMIPLLKFMEELASNKCQRITFDCSSPQGILLFREISKVLVEFGRRVMSSGVERDVYREKYRPISWCLATLSKALTGSYVNFGVFQLYGDKALDDALQVTMQLALTLPLQDIIPYKKVAKNVFTYFETVCSVCGNWVIEKDPATFAAVLNTLTEGIKSADPPTSSGCAGGLDHILSLRFSTHRPHLALHPLLDAHFAASPDLLPRICGVIMECIMFEGCPNQWSLSRPLLPLLLLAPAALPTLPPLLASTLPAEMRPRLYSAFDKLLVDVQNNVEPKNRDKFTQNLSSFRQDVKAFVS